MCIIKKDIVQYSKRIVRELSNIFYKLSWIPVCLEMLGKKKNHISIQMSTVKTMNNMYAH